MSIRRIKIQGIEPITLSGGTLTVKKTRVGEEHTGDSNGNHLVEAKQQKNGLGREVMVPSEICCQRFKGDVKSNKKKRYHYVQGR